MPAFAADAPSRPELGTFVVDLGNRDLSTKPGDDFNRYVNGHWLDTYELKDYESSFGAFNSLRDRSEAQVKAIIDDLRQSVRMLRLLQGDVGSGKTVVALLAACAVAESGKQTALMAPTELLVVGAVQKKQVSAFSTKSLIFSIASGPLRSSRLSSGWFLLIESMA